MFASFKRQKNHMLLFEAMEDVVATRDDTTLLLVGDVLSDGFGDTNSYKHDLLERLRLNGLHKKTLILGRRDDVEWVYPACDITVLPSFHEGTPNAILESLASGVPVIATDVSDNKLIFPDGEAGYIVPGRQQRMLSDKILEFLSSEKSQRDFAKEALRIAKEEYSIEKMIDRVGALYECLYAAAMQ
jgi:glycosyltransferase involved in cell wall biosynthesis